MSAATLNALIFDVDGTLADTERAHLSAFNQAFAEFGLGWVWDEATYNALLAISGGKERVLHYWQDAHPDQQPLGSLTVQETVARIHERKTAHYTGAVNCGRVSLRPGVLRLMDEARDAGLRLAIATTTTPANISALLHRAIGPGWKQHFSAIGDATTSPVKKPHPQVYLHMLAALGLEPAQCLAFEDSSNGLRAARAAGLATVITPTRFTADHDFSEALCVLPDLGDVTLAQLLQWHRTAHTHN